MKKTLLLLVLLASSTAAFAQTNVRLRGTITAIEGDTLSLKTRGAGEALKVKLAPDVGVVTAKATTLDELKPDAYVGVTAMKKGDQMVAVEVHTIGPNVPAGHTPWDLEPGSTMTNANLKGMAKASGGNEITLAYPGGQQKIVVPPGTPVVTQVPADRSALKPGEYVFIAGRKEADGSYTALRVQASKDGVKPPQ
jgi:hypothetical protein